MNGKQWLTVAGSAATLLGLVTLSGPTAWAQDGTPEADAATAPRPAHIHSGNCDELGDVVVALTDLTGVTGGDRVGQARRAITAETSYTSVPLTLDAILGADHAINVHLSADEIGSYIACGELGGRLNADGSLVVGLSELNNSSYAGIAYLNPSADGVSTDVSVFVAPVVGGGRSRDRAAEATPEAAASLPADAATASTPMADAGGDATSAGESVDVSLTEYAIAVPSSLPAGTVTFSVTNDGSVTHSFEVEGAGLEEVLEVPLEPGETGTLTVDLAPGTYEVYCPIGNHASEGMRSEVTVA